MCKGAVTIDCYTVNSVAMYEEQLTQKSRSNHAGESAYGNLSPSHEIPDCVDFIEIWISSNNGKCDWTLRQKHHFGQFLRQHLRRLISCSTPKHSKLHFCPLLYIT